MNKRAVFVTTVIFNCLPVWLLAGEGHWSLKGVAQRYFKSNHYSDT